MAKRKIIWSHRAKIKLTEILESITKGTIIKSTLKRSSRKFKKGVRLLKKQPKLGLRTDNESVRSLIIGDFLVFYEYTKNEIIVHMVWDCQQNPTDLKIK